MFNLRTEIIKNFLISGIICGAIAFLIVRFVIGMPPTETINAAGNAFGAFISGGISAAITVVVIAKKLQASK